MPRFLPIGKEAKGAAGFLLAALPALGALLTALAISGDLIGRMARNHPLASFGAFGSAAVAVFLGAIAAYGLQEGSREERGVLSLGIIVLGVALLFGVYAGVETEHHGDAEVGIPRRGLRARDRAPLERPHRR